jgi:hypothetical protein
MSFTARERFERRGQKAGCSTIQTFERLISIFDKKTQDACGAAISLAALHWAIRLSHHEALRKHLKNGPLDISVAAAGFFGDVKTLNLLATTDRHPMDTTLID